MQNQKIARTLITLDCKRNCKGCCNTQDGALDDAKHIKDIKEIAHYPIICITGGEPMLEPTITLDLIQQIRRPDNTIYLYTALFDPYLYNILKVVDGVHYTIHENATPWDIMGFQSFQKMAEGFPTKSFRLYIDPRCTWTINLAPYIWKRVEVKPWMTKCPLPDGEELFILD